MMSDSGTGQRVRKTRRSPKRSSAAKFEDLDVRCAVYCNVHSILLSVLCASTLEDVDLDSCVNVCARVRAVYAPQLDRLTTTG